MQLTIFGFLLNFVQVSKFGTSPPIHRGRISADGIWTNMGTFAETAIVHYCLWFDDQRKQTSVFCFHLRKPMEVSCFHFPFSENKWKLPFSISSDFPLRKHWDMETYRHSHGDMETLRKNGEMEKWSHKTEIGSLGDFPCLQFVHHATGSSSFVRLLTTKRTVVIRLQKD